jgi:hypothetical protein
MTMASERQNQCAHDGCDCRVEEGQTYCSQYCARADSHTGEEGGGCQCGHAGCGEQAA